MYAVSPISDNSISYGDAMFCGGRDAMFCVSTIFPKNVGDVWCRWLQNTTHYCHNPNFADGQIVFGIYSDIFSIVLHFNLALQAVFVIVCIYPGCCHRVELICHFVAKKTRLKVKNNYVG